MKSKQDFENLCTASGLNVLTSARRESVALGNDLLGVHIFLGLLEDSTGIGGKHLKKFKVTLESVKKEITNVPANIESQAAERVLEQAFEESSKLGHKFIGLEHILLGVLHDEFVVTILQALEIEPELVRTSLLRLLGA